MSLVCIDNHILIWGIRKTATPGQEAMIERTAQLLEYLDEQKTQVIVPAPVIAEFLVGADEHDHTRILQTLQQRFIVAPFDTLAALATARVRRKNRQIGLEASSPRGRGCRALASGARPHDCWNRTIQQGKNNLHRR